MVSTISVRLDESFLRELAKIEKKWQTDRSESVRRLLAEAIKEWKIKDALEKLAEHKISIGKAAEESEVSLWDIIEIARQKNIDWIGYSEEDLERDVKYLQ